MAANGTHSLKITLIDQNLDSRDYKMVVNFFKKPLPLVIKNMTVPVPKEEPAPVESEVYARIQMMDQYGKMRIKFTKEMITSMNITHLNEHNSDLQLEGEEKEIPANESSINAIFHDLMRIYVVPANKWDEKMEGFEMNFINLTW